MWLDPAVARADDVVDLRLRTRRNECFDLFRTRCKNISGLVFSKVRIDLLDAVVILPPVLIEDCAEEVPNDGVLT